MLCPVADLCPFVRSQPAFQTMPAAGQRRATSPLSDVDNNIEVHPHKQNGTQAAHKAPEPSVKRKPGRPKGSGKQRWSRIREGDETDDGAADALDPDLEDEDEDPDATTGRRRKKARTSEPTLTRSGRKVAKPEVFVPTSKPSCELRTLSMHAWF